MIVEYYRQTGVEPQLQVLLYGNLIFSWRTALSCALVNLCIVFDEYFNVLAIKIDR